MAEHTMTIELDMKQTPIMKSFVQEIVNATLKRARDFEDIENAAHDEAFEQELYKRGVIIRGGSVKDISVTFKDTGEHIENVRRIEISVDAQTEEMMLMLYRWSEEDEFPISFAITQQFEIHLIEEYKDEFDSRPRD